MYSSLQSRISAQRPAAGNTLEVFLRMYNIRLTEEILQNCGYDLADVPIYVSSEYGKTKRSGNLFRTVLEHEEVEASKILHIGDNLISDYLMPKKCGMKSFLYRRA